VQIEFWLLQASELMSEIHVIQVTWLDLDSKIVVGSAKTLQGLPSKVRSKALLAFYPYCSCHFTVEQQPQSDKTKVSYRLSQTIKSCEMSSLLPSLLAFRDVRSFEMIPQPQICPPFS
jgi:hypothetical protein